MKKNQGGFREMSVYLFVSQLSAKEARSYSFTLPSPVLPGKYLSNQNRIAGFTLWDDILIIWF
jgi:hypothetical protein